MLGYNGDKCTLEGFGRETDGIVGIESVTAGGNDGTGVVGSDGSLHWFGEGLDNIVFIDGENSVDGVTTKVLVETNVGVELLVETISESIVGIGTEGSSGEAINTFSSKCGGSESFNGLVGGKRHNKI